jgi:GT2 family glycosyltransferase
MNTTNFKAYIILLNYNGWWDTIECLESVVQNDYTNYQVIVVDNNSPNNSMEYIKAWADGKLDVWIKPDNPLRHLSFPPLPKPIPYIFYTREEAEKGGIKELEEKHKENDFKGLSTKYPLIFIQAGENLGFAGGNNLGIRYAQSKDDFEYIWLLNNDTVIDKNTLDKMIKLANYDYKIGMVGSKLYHYHKPGIIQALGGSDRINWYSTGDHIYSLEKDSPAFDTDFEIKGYIYGASLLVKKEVIKDIGILDENYFMWAEEADWCYRASQKGWKLFYCGSSNVWHKEGGSLGVGKHKKFLWIKSNRPTLHRFIMTGYLDIRNHLYFVKKNFGKKYQWIYLITKIIPLSLKKLAGIILFDDEKIKRIALLFRGIKDGFLNKMGKPRELT